MEQICFSIGRDTYDNRPEQRVATNFEDFLNQFSSTGSTRKGQVYICAALAEGQHYDSVKFPGIGHWRIRALALPRRFLALDVDWFSSPAVFDDFQTEVSRWHSATYTTASHTPLMPRARAIVELNRMVDYAEGIAVGEAVQRMLEAKLGASTIKLDPSVYRAVQPVYAPLEGSKYSRHLGATLDVDQLLKSWPFAATSTITSDLGFDPGFKAEESSLLTQALVGLPETPTEIAKVLSALGQISADCGYLFWINILFAIRSTRWACAETLARNWSMSAPHRYDAAVFDSVWRHAKPFGGITVATLFHYAKQASRVGPATPGNAVALNDDHLRLTLTAGQMIIPTVAPPRRTYLFGDVVVPGTVAVMAGTGGVAKTAFAIQVCINGALGRNLGSIQVGTFASLMFLAEETVAERDRRFGALCSRLAAQERARVEKMVRCFAEAGNDLRLTNLSNGHIIETEWVERMIALAQAHQQETSLETSLIVVDHARLVMSGDPIASDHVTALLRALSKVAVRTRSAVLLLAHSPKSTIGKDGEADATEIFGSGAFVDHSRAAFVLHTMREKESKIFGFNDVQRKDFVSLSAVKANYGQANQQWWLRKEVIQGWQTVELVPEFLLPKGQAQMHSSLIKRIIDLVKRKPCQLTLRAIRDQAGTRRELAASERDVKAALQRALDEGTLVLQPPTQDDRRRYKLSANIREVLNVV